MFFFPPPYLILVVASGVDPLLILLSRLEEQVEADTKLKQNNFASVIE